MSFPKPSFNRRSLLGGMLLGGTAIGVSACDNKQNAQGRRGPSTDLEKRSTSGDLKDLMANNPQPVEKLEKGGTLTFSIGSLGPNFNGWSNGGNSVDVSFIMRPIDNAGVWNSEADGTPVLNKDFCTDAKYDDSSGKPVITYTLNEKAAYNDGTPYDWKTFENQWKMMNGSNPDIDVVSTDGYNLIESVKPGKSPKEVIVTLKRVYQPWQDLFSGTFSPKVNTQEIFNNGFVGDLHPDWLAGPFKLETLDTVQKRVALVPNEKWWGKKPILDRIVYRQMESSAELPAFRNGEIDVTGVSTATRYKEIQGTKNMEIRRSQRTSVYGYNFNTTKGNLNDEAVRKAIYQGLDRKALADLRFSGLNWSEKLPGSWMLMGFSPLYEDNFPVKFSKDEAKKTLDSAGWKVGSDGVRSKAGKRLSVSLTNFGDDPTINALAQTFQKNLQELGFDAKIDQKGSGDFGKVMSDRSFEIVAMGYSVGPDPTGVVNQFFNSKSTSNMTGTGTAQIDAQIPKVSISPDIKERAKLANQIEKEFQKLYAMLPCWNGPSIVAFKKGLANYGPSLFQSTDWSIVGWEKGHKQG